MKDNHDFVLGQMVINYGCRGVVWGYHQIAGVETGDLILEDDMGLRWIADPGKCTVVPDAVSHKDGLAVF